MHSFDFFINKASEVGNLATGRHSYLLYGLLRWLQPSTVVEVGSWRGGTAVWMARALQENGKGTLYCIDSFCHPGASKKMLLDNLERCGVDEQVFIIEGKSKEVEWPENVDVAFIDGDHSFLGCQYDISRAIDRGAFCIVVHDTTIWEGPSKWYDSFLAQKEFVGWGKMEVNFDSGLAVVFKNPTIRRVPKEGKSL